jgi:hypothetical protein
VKIPHRDGWFICPDEPERVGGDGGGAIVIGLICAVVVGVGVFMWMVL